MRKLPIALQRAPRLIYLASVLFFIWPAAMMFFEINAVTNPDVGMDNPVVRLTILRGLFDSALDAAFLATSGAMIHVLLAIWAKLPSASDEGVS